MKHFVATLIVLLPAICSADDKLPSWNNGTTKQAILDFVEQATDEQGANYIKPADRIAVFDNDGTLWSEQPAYFQLLFAMDRVKAMASEHPEWKTEQPYKAVLENDTATLMASGKQGLLKIIAATHAGMTTDEFAQIVRDWLRTAKHPTKNVPYTQLTYQPMKELLDFLRQHGFTTYIVSGGGIDFLRVWSEEAYGIPAKQVMGSSVKLKYELRDGHPVLVRLPEIDFIDDGEGKPVGIHRMIGRRPTAAFGNSDGDLQMLQWTASGPGSRFCLLVHHTDSQREWAYDKDSHIGRLDKAMTEAKRRNWVVLDMKADWKTIFSSN